jgi:hypothetical protein
MAGPNPPKPNTAKMAHNHPLGSLIVVSLVATLVGTVGMAQDEKEPDSIGLFQLK